MKKLKFALLFLLFLTASVLYAQDSYFQDDDTDSSDSYYSDDDSTDKNQQSGCLNIPLTIGFQIGSSAWSYINEGTGNNFSEDIEITTPFLSAGFFLDVKYLRLSMNYFKSSGDSSYKYDYDDYATTEIHTDENRNFSLSHYDMQALIKFPFSNCCQNTEIWPAIGVAYSKVIEAKDENGNDLAMKDNINDVWLCFAVGLDYLITKHIVISLSGQADVCLTPELIDYPKSENVSCIYSGARVIFNFGIGYRF